MKRGFPRPTVVLDNLENKWGAQWNNRRYPWPYTASDGYIGESTHGRPLECILFKKCGNCGMPVEGEIVHLIINMEKADGDYLWNESGPFHDKCVRQVMTLCPAMSTVMIEGKNGKSTGRKKYEHATAEWKVVKSMLMATT